MRGQAEEGEAQRSIISYAGGELRLKGLAAVEGSVTASEGEL